MAALRGAMGRGRATPILGGVAMIALALAFGAANALAGPPDDAELVLDINPAGDSGPEWFTAVGGKLYFAADGPDGRELWATDGTAAGTDQVRDINPLGDSDPEQLVNVGGTLFFAATDSGGDTELWRSNGTNAGTVRIADINGGGDSNPDELTDLNGTLLFAASDGSGVGQHGRELWKSDGTPGGTELVKDVNPGTDGSSISGLAAIGDTLYFAGGGNGANNEPWTSDGTELGTTQLKDINTSLAGASSHPTGFTGIGDVVVFAAYGSSVTSGGGTGATQDNELWVTDGTEAGTEEVTDIVAGNGSSLPSELTAIGDKVVFRACESFDTTCGGQEPWISDGTEAGTMRLADIRSGAAGSDPDFFTRVGDAVFFGATDATGAGLWRTDGTAGGTVEVKEGVNVVDRGVDVNGTLVAGIFDDVDAEPWRSDGTGAGTVPIADVNPGGFSYPGSPDGYEPTRLGETVIFRADDGNVGVELFKGADTTPPETAIDSGPSGGASTADRTPTHAFDSDDPPSSFECRVHPTGAATGGFSACSGPGETHTPVVPLADGAYTLEVRATDAAGNTDATPAAASFVVDTSIPEPAAVPEPDTEVADPDVSFTRTIFVKRRQFRTTITAGAQEGVDAGAIGTLVFKPRGRTSAARVFRIRLKPARRPIAGGEHRPLRLRFRGGERKRERLTRRLVGRIRKGRWKVHLHVLVSFTDAAGNTVTKTRVARVRVRSRR